MTHNAQAEDTKTRNEAEGLEIQDSDSEDGEVAVSDNLWKAGIATMAVGVAFILAAPFLFTQFSIAYDLSKKGEIGDAMAGTTAPIVGLVGAVLVFLSLYAQIQANKLVLKEFKED